MKNTKDLLNHPKISIIMPMYNQKDYIEECLLSVMRQTLKNIEIIVVDDGSTDNSVEIVKNLSKNDSRVRVIEKPNAGYGNSMNMGMAAATGEYIGIVETDDFIERTMFEKLYELSKNGTVDVVKSNFWTYYEHKDKTHDEFVNGERDGLADSEEPFTVREQPHILWGHPSVWSAIYKTSFLRENNIVFKEVKGGGWVDNPFYFETLCKAKSIMWTNEPFYHYRKTSANSSSTGIVNPNLPFDRMNDNLDVIEQNNYMDETTKKYLYSRALQYLNGALIECGYDKNFELIDKKAKLLMQRLNPNVIFDNFNAEDQYKYLSFASPIKTLGYQFPKILIYNWLPYDNPWGWGGGVTVYCKNLINTLLQKYPCAQIYFLSSGFAYSAKTSKTFIRQINSQFGDRCKQFEIVNSPIPADQRNVYINPSVAIKNEKLKSVFKSFIDQFGPFKAIHFNNVEGLSFDIFDLKQEYKDTQFLYSIHNYIPMCITNGYFMRHKHCVCSPKHTGKDCLECSRVDIGKDIAHETYKKGLFGIDKNEAISEAKWIHELGIEELDNPTDDVKILDFSKTAKEKINKNCDKILAVSKRVYDIAAAEGFDINKMVVSYIGTKVADGQMRCSNSEPTDKIKVVFLGSDLYFEEKGYPFLLSSLETLEEKYASKIDLVLTMRQNEDEKIKERLKLFNSVEIIHGYTHAELPKIFSGCHLSIVPVVWEDNLPQIAIESVAYGVPVLSSNFGGASELCSSEKFKFKGGDKKDFLTKLKHFVDNPSDIKTYWEYHKGLVTMEDHIKQIIDLYNLPKQPSKIEINTDDLYFLLEENKFLHEHVSINGFNSSREDQEKINKFNQYAQTIDFLEKEKFCKDGLYVSMVRKLNKMFPHNSKRRKFMKRLFGKKNK